MKRLLVAMMLLPLGSGCSTVSTQEAAITSPRAVFASQRIGVTVRGSGPDVVLIPGLSSSPRAWESTVAAMPGYRYHMVHVSGFAGRAPGANATGPVVAPVAEEIARYIREAGLRRPAVVGHSLGGTWAMMVAARHPDLVSRLMVVDMTPFVGAMFMPNATPESVKPLAAQIQANITSSAGAARKAQAERTIATMVRTEALRAGAVEDTVNSDAPVSGQAMYDLATTDLTPEIAKIRVPMTVVFARAPNAPVSDEQMTEYYRKAYAGVPHARVVRIPNAYHFIQWDEPEAFQREMRSLMAKR